MSMIAQTCEMSMESRRPFSMVHTVGLLHPFPFLLHLCHDVSSWNAWKPIELLVARIRVYCTLTGGKNDDSFEIYKSLYFFIGFNFTFGNLMLRKLFESTSYTNS